MQIIKYSLLVLLIINTSLYGSQTIRVAYIQDYPPFSFVDKTGAPNGVLIDWWKLLAEKTGTDLKFIPGKQNECISLVRQGGADVICAMFYDEKLTESLSYCEYISQVSTILFLRDNQKPKSVSEITGTIAFLDNMHQSEELITITPEIKTKNTHSFDDFSALVNSKKLAGFVYDVPNPPAKFKFNYAPKGYYQYKVIHTERLRPTVKKGNKELVELIITGSAQISDNDLAAIAEKWAFYKKDEPARNLVIIFIAVIAILLFLALWYIKKQKRKYAQNTEPNEETNWKGLIAKGENDFVEFKSSLRWDYRQEKLNKGLENVIAKTISAFLNTNGGTLFIGVDDSGTPLGLEPDCNTLSKKNSDGFLLALTNLINQQLGKKYHEFISVNLVNIDDKAICAIAIQKSNSPVFISKNDQDEFYIRASASSQPLKMSEAMDYIQSHFNDENIH